MTQLGSGGSGRISFPYSPGSDNHYAVATTNKDVLQCKLILTRNSDNGYSGTVYDSTGTAQGTASQTLPNAQDSMTIPGQNDLLDLAITSTAPIDDGDVGEVGPRVDFNYGAASFATFELGTDFAWSSSSTGCDDSLNKFDPDQSKEGGYCIVPFLGDGAVSVDQQIECYIPCNASQEREGSSGIGLGG